MSSYAYPTVLVDTPWVAEHLDNPTVRLVEGDVNPTLYDTGHIPGTVFWNVMAAIVLPDFRTNLDKAAFESLLSQSGISAETTVVLYSNIPSVAPWTFWFLKLFGHNDVRLLNGGRKKWIAEGRPLTTDRPIVTPTHYLAKDPDPSLRVPGHRVREAIGRLDRVIIDVRTPKEYSGELFFTKPPEGTERAGHIPSAVNILYDVAVQDDGTFKSVEALTALYSEKGVEPEKETIAYCTFGGRTSHTWFVLKYLLGYENVQHYDAGWMEWGRLPEMPVEQ